MSETSKKCWSCRSFNAYYTRGYCCLLKEDNGFCSRRKEVVQKSDGCDNWHCRNTTKNVRQMIAVNSIPEIYHKLAVIEQILKEEEEILKIRIETDDTN